MKLQELPLDPVAGARAAPLTALRGGRHHEASDWVAEEVPVALVYNGISHAVMLATPSDLEDFALGFTLTEGIVEEASQVYGIELLPSCDGAAPGLTVAVDIAARCEQQLKERRRTLAGRTGCGLCGTDSLEQAVRPPHHVTAATPIDAARVSAALVQMRAQQRLLAQTGATHAAAWCDAQGQVQLLREDVGRHNALDKLVGALVRQGIQAGTGFIAVTSRASYEMVHKTAAAGVPLLAAISGVTGLAIDTARDAGVTLIGFARGTDLNVYTHAQGIVLGQEEPALISKTTTL